MIYSLAARIYLMMYDYNCGFWNAWTWVCRRIPANFRGYYAREINDIFMREVWQ